MKELEEYAKINKIPIMQKDGILYLCNYIKENNIKSVLEIGSAIGYSSIMMANVNNDIMVIDKYCKNKINIWIKLDCLIDKPCTLNKVNLF